MSNTDSNNAGPGEKSAADLEREKVTVNTPKEKDDVEAKDDDTEKGEDTEVETKEEDVDGEKEVEASEEDDTEKEKKRQQRTQERLTKRIDKVTSEKKALEARVRELEDKLKKDDKEGLLTKEDVEREAKKIAEQEVSAIEFQKAADRIFKDAVKVDKDFKKKVDAMAEDIGAIPGQMIPILDDLDNKGAVISYLTENIEEAEEIYSLNPTRMALRLAKISDKLVEKRKKDITKAPAPANNLGGGGNRSTQNQSYLTRKDLSDKEWVEQRARDVAEKRKSGERPNLR